MRLERSTELLAPADKVWTQAKRASTLAHVARGLLGVRAPGGLPALWREGESVRVRLWLFHVIPLWRHEIEILRVDERELALETRESGGPVRRWEHRIAVEQSLGPRSRYSDVVEIEAGVLTPLVWLSALPFFLWRQARWRRLARTL